MKSRKKILFFHHAGNIGGASLSGLNLLLALPNEEYDIVVYCNTSGGPVANIYENEGFKVIKGGTSPVGFMHFSGGELFAFSIRALLNYFNIFLDSKRIRKVIEIENPDIVIVNSMTLFWIGRIAKEYKAQTVCFFRETYIQGLLGARTKYIKLSLSRFFDKVAFISSFDLEQNSEIKAKKKVIYNALKIDEKELKEPILNSFPDKKVNEFKILFVGGMLPIKGALVLLKAIPFISQARVKIIFCGYDWKGKRKDLRDCKTFKEKVKYIFSKDYEKKCIDYILDNNLSANIEFMPPQGDIGFLYSQSDALVFPATKPHQARPIFEAGFAGIPVIISDFPNIRENIDQSSGFLFENKNYKELADVIDKLALDPSLANPQVVANYRNTIDRHLPSDYRRRVQEFLTS